jgi:hypothetical protein
MESGIFGAKPLETFFPALANMESVQAALHEELGGRSASIVDKLKSGSSLSDCELAAAHDIISDVVHNSGASEWGTAGLGDRVEFGIVVVRFGPVYWIEAGEADPIGYFETLDRARDVAEMNYEPFISALARQKEEDE